MGLNEESSQGTQTTTAPTGTEFDPCAIESSTDSDDDSNLSWPSSTESTSDPKLAHQQHPVGQDYQPMAPTTVPPKDIKHHPPSQHTEKLDPELTEHLHSIKCYDDVDNITVFLLHKYWLSTLSEKVQPNPDTHDALKKVGSYAQYHMRGKTGLVKGQW